MRIGIMQPYFFPYLGYFSLISNCDRFILLDNVQFIRHGWIERNRILKPDAEWQYIHAPLKKHSQTTLIKNIELRSNEAWGSKIISQLQHYKKRAPFFPATIDLLQNVFLNQFTGIAAFNLYSIQTILAYLGVFKPVELFSAMKIVIDAPTAPDEWALNICKAVPNVTEYWNPAGGRNIFDRDKYSAANVPLKFHSCILQPYLQKGAEFCPALSIIDVMMFNSPDSIRKMLSQYELS